MSATYNSNARSLTSAEQGQGWNSQPHGSSWGSFPLRQDRHSLNSFLNDDISAWACHSITDTEPSAGKPSLIPALTLGGLHSPLLGQGIKVVTYLGAACVGSGQRNCVRDPRRADASQQLPGPGFAQWPPDCCFSRVQVQSQSPWALED